MNVEQVPELLPAEIPVPSLKSEGWSMAKVVSFTRHAGYAVTGQAFFAGAHFIVNVLLARWLPAEEYGAFALAYACFLLFLLLYNACIYEPLVIFGSGKYADSFLGYLNRLLKLNIPILAVVTLTMLGIAVILGRIYSPSVRQAFVALAFAAPFVLITWLARGALYSQLCTGAAAIGGSLYLLSFLGLLLWLWHQGRLSPSTSFMAMGAAGFIAGFWLLRKLGVQWRHTSNNVTVAEVLSDHWRYGRWAVASAVIAWFPENVYYATLGTRTTLSETAALRALVNLINPIVHVQIALTAVLIPALVRRHARAGLDAMSQAMARLNFAAGAGALVYLGTLLYFRFSIFRVLYKGNYEAFASAPLCAVALLPVATGAIMVFGSGLRAMERPDSIFWSYMAGLAVTLGLGLPFSRVWGVAGATLGLLIARCVTAVSMFWLFCRCRVSR